MDLLRRALAAGRVAQAYAFVGPAGSGRMTTARAFAQALLCDTGQSCGRCRGCLLVA
ncbi:MAG TPA: DNA polymerase III subunit delta', partial [Methylomirabilota bacterium]|nr:DNA polymerase III subunit delta' [Methylomirabilota bacterium]